MPENKPLIINAPYGEPTQYWEHVHETQTIEIKEGRRPAGYVIYDTRHRGAVGRQRTVTLALVNQIRPHVKAWQEGGYRGASGITRTLLSHWHGRGKDEKPFFFCQLEAIETLIWLVEIDGAKKHNIVIPGDGGVFERLCSKLATGTGKTVVMAMLIAWQTLNKNAAPHNNRFARDFLIIAPGLTVKDRLQVLHPTGEENYYEEFDIVPPAMREKLNAARIRILNWQALAWESEEKILTKRGVDKRGAKSLNAYAREVLGDLADAKNFIVINDEAHHAWRQQKDIKVTVSAEEKNAATVWISALDRLHQARGIMRCFDFSATPFIPSGHANIERLVYQWIVSDFGLNDAIEAGLVKTPRIVLQDDALVDAKSYRSRLWHIYNDNEVKSDLSRAASKEESLPDLVRNAYTLLGADWKKCQEAWKDHPVPPTMISVVNRVNTADRILHAIHNAELLNDVCNPEKTLQIDSDTLKKAESGGDGGTKSIAAQELRKKVNTVGQPGEPGADIEHIVSVAMLSEGWDAKTVTHIMGLRAFDSQLLCEQVVGRGLRRISYDTDENGMFQPEYVNVFGVPFDIIESHEGSQAPPPPPPKVRIETDSEKAAFALKWPNILRVDATMRKQLHLDWKKVDTLTINASETILSAELGPVVAGKTVYTDLAEIDLRQINDNFRYQSFVFKATHDALQNRPAKWHGDKLLLAAQIVNLADEFIAKKLSFNPPLLTPADKIGRQILIGLNFTKIINHFYNAVATENAEHLTPVFDTAKPIRGTADMRPWHTSRPLYKTSKSHVNFCVVDSTWEDYAAKKFDQMKKIKAWAKNDHLGFDIVYIFRGVVRKYYPDFIFRLADNSHVILEVKGQELESDKAKWAAAKRWCEAVNSDGRFGKWHFETAQSPDDVVTTVQKLSP